MESDVLPTLRQVSTILHSAVTLSWLCAKCIVHQLVCFAV